MTQYDNCKVFKSDGAKSHIITHLQANHYDIPLKNEQVHMDLKHHNNIN